MEEGIRIATKSKTPSQFFLATQVALTAIVLALGFHGGQYYQLTSLVVFIVPVPVVFLTINAGFFVGRGNNDRWNCA